MHSQFFHFELDFMQFSKQPFAAFLNGDFLLILQYRSARFCLLFFLNESVPSEPLCDEHLARMEGKIKFESTYSFMLKYSKIAVWLAKAFKKIPRYVENVL